MTWAIDLGSTSIKCCRFDLDEELPVVLQESSFDCPLNRPRPGWVEHDLRAMSSAFEICLEAVPSGGEVGMASAMHALVLLDQQGEPLCDALSWADTRSQAQAVALRSADPEGYSRTGVPLHSMAWPAKLFWLRQERPDWWKRLRRATDLKSYLWEKATGQQAPLDLSSATGTGLWNRGEAVWDPDLCRRLQLEPDVLPRVELDHRLEWRNRTLHLGGADGPLGNLGLGAVCQGCVAISVGTSGAVRRFCSEALEPADGLFLYALDQLGWVEGGAISNGGSVLPWLRQQSSNGSPSNEEIMGAIEGVEVGAGGIRVHPYFLGERAPHWRSGVKPAVHGENESHRFSQLARATLEGVAFCLHRLLVLMESSGPKPVRCTGGMFASPVWCQLLADVTGREIALGFTEEATALGAALLTRPDALQRAKSLPLGASFQPCSRRHRGYREVYQQWLKLDPIRTVITSQ